MVSLLTLQVLNMTCYGCLHQTLAVFLSREDIFERLRGIEYDGQDRSIDVRISRIRQKLAMILKIKTY